MTHEIRFLRIKILLIQGDRLMYQNLSVNSVTITLNY